MPIFCSTCLVPHQEQEGWKISTHTGAVYAQCPQCQTLPPTEDDSPPGWYEVDPWFEENSYSAYVSQREQLDREHDRATVNPFGRS